MRVAAAAARLHSQLLSVSPAAATALSKLLSSRASKARGLGCGRLTVLKRLVRRGLTCICRFLAAFSAGAA